MQRGTASLSWEDDPDRHTSDRYRGSDATLHAVLTEAPAPPSRRSPPGPADDACAGVPPTGATPAVEVAEATGVGVIAPPEAPPEQRRRALAGLVLGMLVLGGLSAAFIFVPVDWDAVGSWGYLGVFGVVFVATASVALPIPYLLVVARAAGSLDPLGIAVVAGVAGMLGELAGYLIGIGGSGLVPHGRLYERARHWICTYGFWCIALFACVPNPFFDAVGVVAGTLRYSWWRFAVACFLGKSIKFLVAALVGMEIVHRGWK